MPDETPQSEIPRIGTIVTPFLDPVEMAILEGNGLAAADFAAIVAPAAGLQMQVQATPGQPPMLVLQLQIPIDYVNVLPLKMSTLVDPRTGQQQPTEESLKAIPMCLPPLVRFFIRADQLGPAAKAELSRIKMARVTAMMGPRPTLNLPAEGDAK